MLQRLWIWLIPSGAARLPLHSYVALGLMTLALHLPGQIGVPAMDRDEARFAQATKQMIASGDFIDIRLGDEPRYLQPVGIYWLQSIPATLAGGADAPITAFRVPSILAALSAVLLTAWLGTRMAGPTVGLGAGMLLAMSLLLSVESHFAKTDSVLLLTVLSAQAALWFTIERVGVGRVKFIGPPLFFWLAVGAGVLIKGPIIALVVGLTCAAFALWTRSMKFLGALNPLLGLAIVAAMAAPWLIAIYVKTEGEFFRVAIGHSFGGKIAGAHDKHGAPPGYHLALFMLTFFPGVLLAGVGAARVVRHRNDTVVRFLVSWVVPTFVLFEMVGTKLPHYTLPVFPALAILAAWGLKDAGLMLINARARWVHRATTALFVVGGLAVAAVPIVGQNEIAGAVGADAMIAGALGLLAVAAGLFLAWRPEPSRLPVLAGAVFLTYAVTFQGVIPNIDAMWVSDRASKALGALEGCAKVDFATAGYREPSNLFHFGRDTFLATDGALAAQFLAAHERCGLIMLDMSARERFEAAAAAEGLAVKSLGGIKGKNYVDGADLDIEYVVAASTALSLPLTDEKDKTP